MNYDRMSNKKLYRLVRTLVPAMPISEVDETNRNTIIAFLKVSGSEMGFTGTSKRVKRPVRNT